jgi:hypothetical protein
MFGGMNKKFLPIDAYDPCIDTENPNTLVKLYCDESTGLTLAKSKWFFGNGEHEQKNCIVNKYIPEEELFEIQWQGNHQTKKVSRFNLVFAKEDQSELQKRIDEAKVHRASGELIMKYNYMI